MNTFRITSLLVCLALSLPLTAVAEEGKADSPRFMLGGSQDAVVSEDNQTQPSERDFSWKRLAKDTPASGADPIIGDRRYANYYDFRDGLPAPLYFQKK